MSIWVRHIFRVIATTSTLAFFGCDSGDLCSHEEVSRVTSPDDIVDAVIVQKNCGTTASNAYRVYVIKKDWIPNSEGGDPVFVSDNTDDIYIHWGDDKQLLISYAKARIFHFKNFWHSKEVDDFAYIVSVTENVTKFSGTHKVGKEDSRGNSVVPSH